MKQPKKCIVCKESLEIIRGFPGWMRYSQIKGGIYGGPIAIPQCKACGADAYADSRGWHIRNMDYRKPGKMFSIRVPA